MPQDNFGTYPTMTSNLFIAIIALVIMGIFNFEEYIGGISTDLKNGKKHYAVLKIIAGILCLIIFLGAVIGAMNVILGSKSEKNANYSSTQTVKLIADPQVNYLNLNNIATLRPDITHTEFRMDKSEGGSIRLGGVDFSRTVTLFLDERVYVHGYPEVTENTLGYTTPGEIPKEETFVFDTYSDDKRSYEIKVKGRTFLVTLFTIKNISSSTSTYPNFEYNFGIIEK